MPPEEALSPRLPGDDQYEACYDERFAHGYMSEWPMWRRRRIGQFVDALSLPPTGRALDFGCGQGVFTSVLQDTLPGWKVWGTDLSTVGLREAARRVPRARFAVGGEIASHGPFDFIFTHHVLEHVGDLDATLAFLTSLLAPNGQMLHILPCGNPGSFEHGICRLRTDGVDPTNGRFFFDEDGHVRRLTTKTLSRAAEAQGFILAHDAYSAQFWAAVDRISSQEHETIAAMFDPSRAVDPAARRRLSSLRLGLMVLRLLKRPPAVLFRGAARDVLGHADWSWRDRAVLTASNPVFLVAFPLRAALRRLATREWDRHRSESNGSEMYLHFIRPASVPPALRPRS